MDQLTHVFDVVLAFLQAGYDQVNALLGLFIALFAMLQLSSWRKLWEVALAATLIHIVALVLIPVLDHYAPLHLPPLLQLGFWRNAAALYVGYVIVIAVFFFIRVKLFNRSGAKH